MCRYRGNAIRSLGAGTGTNPRRDLSDIKIIDGTGPEAVAEIRSRLGPLPVIFITGTPEACEACDYAAAILTKPFIPHHVISAFRQVAPA